ncbi:MAG: MotA/TolQ/ExbB proton channel family protein [Balneolales bacterium]
MRVFISMGLLFAIIILTGITQTTDISDSTTSDTASLDGTGLVIGEDSDVEISNFWDLIGQAGPIRYPIFGIFLVGVFLITIKAFELFMDQRQSMPIETATMQDLNLSELTELITKQADNMLSHISATLLNVFKTKNTDSLHDEVANYVRFQHDNFNTFRIRIDFLSDTAGALGLLGTVWGMFIVFSSGDLEKEIILTGMGIALLTTLLGLVVSIGLNFLSTLAQGYFMKRLEQVKSKAEEIRFRLLEIQDTRIKAKAIAPSNHAKQPVPVGIVDNDSYPDEDYEEKKEEITLPQPAYLRLHNNPKQARAGSRLSDIKVSVFDKNESPVQGVIINAIVSDGKLGNTEMITDMEGKVFFNWTLGSMIGRQVMEVKVEGSTNSALSHKLNIDALAGDPKELSLKNNHQSGIPNKKIKNPIIAEVRDEFGNPVEGCNVHLEITAGNGKLGYGKESVVLSTNREGSISIPFTLGNEPGFNVVDISIKKAGINKKYQAMGQEV